MKKAKILEKKWNLNTLIRSFAYNKSIFPFIRNNDKKKEKINN